MKQRYLAVYDYGAGGLWLLISAGSKEQITARYPVLTVFDTPPEWMTKEDYDRIAETKSCDIDDEPPEWLLAAMREQGFPN